MTVQNPTGASTATKEGMFNIFEYLYEPYKNRVRDTNWLRYQ